MFIISEKLKELAWDEKIRIHAHLKFITDQSNYFLSDYFCTKNFSPYDNLTCKELAQMVYICGLVGAIVYDEPVRMRYLNNAVKEYEKTYEKMNKELKDLLEEEIKKFKEETK